MLHVFVKGADSAILPVCFDSEGAATSAQKQVDGMAIQGLRTLVYGHRQIDSECFTKYVQDIENAKSSLVDRLGIYYGKNASQMSMTFNAQTAMMLR